MSKRITKKWSAEEEELLKDNYENVTMAELRNVFPHRTDRSITRKAQRMGLRKSEEVIRRMGLEGQAIGYVEKYPELTKEKLKRLYLVERKSSVEIGVMFGCTGAVVLNRLHRFDIPRRTCPSEYTREERRDKWGREGERHHNWKGGITEISGLIRNAVSHVSLKRFRIDGFKCIQCGEDRLDLNAHHIRPFSEIVSDIRAENGLDKELTTWEEKNRLVELCENDPRLLDVNNLVTLCEECHVIEHRKMRKETEAAA